jgi:hypothetical protein
MSRTGGYLLTYIANHCSTVTAWLRVLALTLSCSLGRVGLPVTEDTCLLDDTFSVTCRIGDKAPEDDGIVPNVLPVLLGCRAEMNDVRTGDVFANYGQQLVL